MATNGELQELPLLQDTPVNERENLFLQKLQQCCMSFDFAKDRLSALQLKQMKARALFEMFVYISSSEGVITEAMHPEIVRMFCYNVFHTLPPPSNPTRPEFDTEEEDHTLKAENHVLLAYGFFLAFLESPDLKINILRLHINQKFVLQLLEFFDSEDIRERVSLKKILHRIYGMLPGLREYIRKEISNIFYRFIYETVRHNGISELLDVLASIISGYAVPLRKENKEYLLKVLMPLHKSKCLGMYHSQLVYCVTLYLEKDPILTESVVNVLLKLWPKTQSQKELLFLKQLEEILEQIDPEEFPKVMVPVFKQLAKCISCPHHQVAKHALSFLSNQYIMYLASDHVSVLFPIVIPSLWGRAHWDERINGLIYNVKMVFMQINSQLLNECVHMYENDREAIETKIKEREDAWKKIETLASQNLELNEGALLNANNMHESASVDRLMPVDEDIENKDMQQLDVGRKCIQIGV